MNAAEAKRILLLYRPGRLDAPDPEMTEALDLARRDPELQGWFEDHCRFQTALQRKLRAIEAPADLKARILAQQRIVPRPVWWLPRPLWLGVAAAAMVLCGGLAALWIKPGKADRFADFQVRMVSTMRGYAMDVKTNDMVQVRQFLAAKGAPADYDLPQGLERLQLTGAAFLRWHSKPVSMVCFNRGDDQMLYLFVMDRSAVKDPPPADARMATTNKVQLATWCRGDKAYLLAGPAEPDFKKYL